jgi:AcrR family transcriptional regulator
MMGRRKKYDNSEAVILEAAKELFTRYGFHRTTLEDISKATQLGKASIYQCFESKEAILLAVVDQSLKALHTTLKETTLQQCDSAPVRSSKKAFLEVVKHLLFQEAWTKFKDVSANFSGQDAFMLPPPIPPLKARTRFAEWEMMFTELLVDVLLKGVAYGHLTLAHPPEKVAKTLRSAMAGFFPPLVLIRQLSEEDFTAELNVLLEVLCKGL